MRFVLIALLVASTFAADSAPAMAVTGGRIRGVAVEKGGV